MQLFVRDLAGQTHVVSATADSSVECIKQQLPVPVDEQSLIFAGRSLDNADVLGACGVTDESTLFLSMELSGGGKKRKKKTYTKPKKIKHKRKKVSCFRGAHCGHSQQTCFCFCLQRPVQESYVLFLKGA